MRWSPRGSNLPWQLHLRGARRKVSRKRHSRIQQEDSELRIGDHRVEAIRNGGLPELPCGAHLDAFGTGGR